MSLGRTKFAAAGLLVAAIAALSLASNASAVPVDPPVKTCLDKLVGSKATNALINAKKLSKAQTAQVAKCQRNVATSPTSPASPASGSTSGSTSGMVALNYVLLSTVVSLQSGLGNISDPALVQVADGSVRMFFMNGNEPQAGISGYDNLQHSYVSNDGGKTWTLESGVRMNVQSPVSVNAINGAYEAWGKVLAPGNDQLMHFTSANGKDFTSVGGGVIAVTACKGISGASAAHLGDPQMVKVATGYIAYAQDAGTQTIAPFTRFVCALTSTDGTTWMVDASKTISYSTDIATNLETFRNASGVIEQIIPIDIAADPQTGARVGMQVRTSTNDGASWSALSELSFWGADPDRLDLANGDSLLAFGGFDSRVGGLLAVAKKQTTSYKASRVESGIEKVIWVISGAAS
ncbi:MAG: hypothetical protein D4R44_07605, partial [Actinobacteria bacterium]